MKSARSPLAFSLLALALVGGCNVSVEDPGADDLGPGADAGSGRANPGGSVPSPGAPSSPGDPGAPGGGTSTDGGTGGQGGPTGGDTGGTPKAAPGFFRTAGSRIVDDKGATVRLTGVNWFGLETEQFAPFGLDRRELGSLLDQIKTLGFNVIRLPFSSQALDAGSTPKGLEMNPSLNGKTPLEIMDAVIAGAKARGLKVILDRHRPNAAAQSELWYTGAYPEDRWISDWKKLATRYKNEPTVIGFDLHNEPHGPARWGSGDVQNDWRLAAERAGNAILGVHPNLLIVVEGVEQHEGKFYWWGGNLRGVKTAPVRLAVEGRVVYSPHDYPASLFEQAWFKDATYPANLPAVWEEAWGYVAKEGIAPIYIGEFGSKLENPKDEPWMKGLVSYAQAGGLSFSFWSLNPNSGDTGGILQDDWQTVQAQKHAIVKPGLAPLFRVR